MDVNEVLLPGVGVRYEFDNRDGDRIGVIARRDGEFEVVVYDSGDPDQCRSAFRLSEEEAEAVAQILGAPRISERFADLPRRSPGSSPARSRSDRRAGTSTHHSATPAHGPAPAPPWWPSCAGTP